MPCRNDMIRTLVNPESFQKCSFFVVIHQNKIVGSAGLVPDHDNGWELTAVAINQGGVISEGKNIAE